MNLAGIILKNFGWTVSVTVPDYPKCIICVAPHTSNWDFILGKLAYASVGRKAGFLMKSSWFIWPLGVFFKALGGVPVHRKRKKISLTDVIVKKFQTSKRLAIAITPEGTRSRNADWHTGFLHIAYRAEVPIILAGIDYDLKVIIAERTFEPTGNAEEDMRRIKSFYRPFLGKYPEKFTTE